MPDNPLLEPRRGLVSRWLHRRAVRRVRRQMSVLGFPLDGLTDSDIEEGVKRIGEVASRTGITAAEAGESMARFSVMVREKAQGDSSMSEDPRLEVRRNLVCRECGWWCHASSLDEARLNAADFGLLDHCGQPLVETWRDPAFLELDRALSELRISLAGALRVDKIVAWLDRKLRRWRRTDA